MTMTPAPTERAVRDAFDPTVLRAEHDDLARRLARRTSIDEARKAIYAGFAAFIAGGLTVKLAFDRWVFDRAPPPSGVPLFLLVALTIALVLIALAVHWAGLSRHHMRREDALYARFRLLRDLLGFDR